MEIKEAIEFIKNSPPEIKEENGDDFEKFTEANLTILNAIYNGGYTLCKVDEAVEKMKTKYLVSGAGNILECIDILKEACK